MTKPEITILIPTFNRRKFLPLIIRNIFIQDYPHEKIKVLFDDDGENKLFQGNELEEIKKQFHPINFQYNSTNKWRNIGKKRNDMIKECKTNLFCFMDDDDIYFPTYLSHSYKVMKDNKAGCVGSDKMLFVMTDKDYKIYGMNCGNNINLIHEATIMATKKWFKGSCKFSGEAGEGKKLFQGQRQKVAITDISKIMICIQHDTNTIDKLQFADEKTLLKEAKLTEETRNLIEVIRNYKDE